MLRRAGVVAVAAGSGVGRRQQQGQVALALALASASVRARGGGEMEGVRRLATGAAATDESKESKRGVTLTPRAMDRIKALRSAKQSPELRLRLAVEGGGCSGFSYKFSTTDAPLNADDVTFGDGGALCIDETSLGFVDGARIDFTEDLIRRSFEVVDNPQSESKCGCGASFSPKA